MNISENIRWITESGTDWRLFRNRAYSARIQRADPGRVYNVPGSPGIVYNYLEDSYEKVVRDGYVITGAAGEMWVIGRSTLGKYMIEPEDITDDPVIVRTRELDTVCAAVRIPVETQFTLETDYGEKAMLKGNRPGLDHGAGDYVLTSTKHAGGVFLPNLTDCGRIINGVLFDMIYKPFSPAF